MESGLFITNIKSAVEEKALRNFFGKFGTITYLSLVMDKFNSNNKVCYLNYSSVESAKVAIENGDKSTIFGSEMRMTYKKIANNKSVVNGCAPLPISRNQSVGRGRGMPTDFHKAYINSDHVVLRNTEIPLNTKVLVEIVELKSLTSILARPLRQTERSKQDLNESLVGINEQVNSLVDVRIPEIDEFYLAKWEEDNKFYRAKLLEKLGNNKYKVCFVDEGTSGDIVTELKEIPKELAEFPCQFVHCDMECEENPDLIQLIINNGDELDVSIYVTSRELNSGKYRINLFIGENDVIELFEKKYRKDPRKKPFPGESALRKHQLQSEFTNYKIVNYPKQRKDLFRIVVTDNFENNPKTESIECSPIPGDLVIYRQSDNCLLRCVIDNFKFNQNKIIYKIRLLDEDKILEAPIESLLRTNDKCLFAAPRLLNCILDARCELPAHGDVTGTIVIDDYDSNKDVYIINIIKSVMSKDIIGQPISVLVSHVESCSKFYIQYMDEQSVLGLEQIQVLLNGNYQAPRVSMRDLNINQLVVAPYLGDNYRAHIKEIDADKSNVLVFFIDYGNCERIKLIDILQATSDKIIRTAPFAFQCKLSVMIKPICLNQADELLRDYIGQGEVEVSMKVLSEENDILSVDLLAKNKSSFLDILQFKKIAIDTVSSRISDHDDQDNLIARIQDLEKRISYLEKMVKK